MSMNGIYAKDKTCKFGSPEKFNRVLYGGHANDDIQERFFTFAGDAPIFMGASSDFTRNTWCYQAKNGILMSGLATTPGYSELSYQGGRDIFSSWFHQSTDTVSRWHHGYMSYELTRFSPYFPDARVKIEVYPLNPHNGFLVRYDITTDQRLIFCAGFGGITPFFGRFEYQSSPEKEFRRSDCDNNTAEILDNCACVKGPNDVSMLIGTDFDCKYELDSVEAMEEKFPSMFLNQHGSSQQIIKISRVIEAGSSFTGHILVLQNSTPDVLRDYLAKDDIESFLRSKIREKYASVLFKTEDEVLDATVPDIIIAQDAAFHARTFYHGAIGYHAPFLGWRGWYAPTLLGWVEEVKSAIINHFNTITRCAGEEKVWWDGGDRPDLDHEGTQYHRLINSSGKLTALLHCDDIYDMQEVAVDMTIYYLEHYGDRETCNEIFDRLCEVLDWEERIFDPDGDGLYQNFLNTWISDGHSYNGAACAQASSYNYAANSRAAKLGKMLGKDVSKLTARAERIQKAFQDKIWQDAKGIPAESIDTIGNKLVHDDPELSTIYLAADCGNTDWLQTYRMLKWVERNIVSVKTVNRGGTLYYSSNWIPKKYSTCGIFSAENACLALTYFQNGQTEKAMEIVNGLSDAFALSPHPGSITHVLASSGGTDDGDVDFTDVSSCYLRLLFEGLWGVRFTLSENLVSLKPQLPGDWNNASLSLPGVNLTLSRSEMVDTLTAAVEPASARKLITLPMRYSNVDQVFLNGRECNYEIVPGIGQSFLQVSAETNEKVCLQIYYQRSQYPELANDRITSFNGNLEKIKVINGELVKIIDCSGILETVKNCHDVVKINAAPGIYDVLAEVRSGKTTVYLPIEIEVANIDCEKETEIDNSVQTQIDLNGLFNVSLTEIHQQEYRSPRPENYSIGMRLNGRYAWEWNHYGHNALVVDDSLLRNAGGCIKTASGLVFKTPESGFNSVTVSIWDNFPTAQEIPLSGSGRELAVLLCGTTNAMQSYVVNAKLTVKYTDNSTETVELIPPVNFEDFLIDACQSRNESVYFSNGTHGMVQKISLNPDKELSSITAEAIANEVILNILGVTLVK